MLLRGVWISLVTCFTQALLMLLRKRWQTKSYIQQDCDSTVVDPLLRPRVHRNWTKISQHQEPVALGVVEVVVLLRLSDDRVYFFSQLPSYFNFMILNYITNHKLILKYKTPTHSLNLSRFRSDLLSVQRLASIQRLDQVIILGTHSGHHICLCAFHVIQHVRTNVDQK